MNNILWKPDLLNIKELKMSLFMDFVNKTYSTSIKDYSELYSWSIERADLFWKSVSVFLNIKYSSEATEIKKKSDKFYHTEWFCGAKLNYAENILNAHNSDSLAIQFFNELGEESSLTYSELYSKVASLSTFFKNLKISKGDRIAAMMPNVPETIISSLACSSIGAIWSSCSPDFGDKAIFDRFNQISPKVLVLCNSYTFKGKLYDCTDKIKYLLSNLKSVEHVIIFNYRNLDKVDHPKSIYWDEINFNSSNQINFEQMNFKDPLYIMFSSGTTGKPKSIVHSIGGTLIQHAKELGLHINLSENEKILYYTTCGWMMWNWLLSGLYFKSTVVLYEGSPFFPNIDSLIELLDRQKINIFGTSARYISYLASENIIPKEKWKLEKLRLILSTGSTLAPEDFDYVYANVKTNIQLSSISGGTDIISCFALGNPLLEVRRGELQCLGLGMNVASYSSEGKSLKNKKGELVCLSPFPSMPVYFWDDNNDKKYYSSYFDKYQNIWTHGDFIEIKDSQGVIIYGRSDATLNPAGIRIGTAEIYSALSGIEYIADSIAVDSSDANSYILFVKMIDDIKISGLQLREIEKVIKENLSPKHLPSKILQVLDIPYTINGKKTEIAVKKMILGEEVDNLQSIKNPECLKQFSEGDVS